MASNTAAWLTGEKVVPLEVKPAPYTAPADDQIVIKTRAVAINPVDWAVQSMGDALFKCPYPCILGADVAGEVFDVGSKAQFKKGDRVLGFAIGISPDEPNSQAAFQNYVVLENGLTTPIPDSMSFESACVFPLGLSTAATGMFQKNYLALQLPTVPPTPTGETLLIWSGASSVGSNAIQLAVHAGYEVITTCSPKNFPYVKKLGAAYAFDYNSETVRDDILAVFKGRRCAGAVAIGSVTAPQNGAVAGDICIDIVARSEGKKMVAAAMHINSENTAGVEVKFILGSSLKKNELGPYIYTDFLPKALAAGSFVSAPEPVVVGQGLGAIQDAFDIQKKGPSAKKIVVSIE